MFEKVNYISLIILIAILSFMIYKDGKTFWKENPGIDFYALAARIDISDKEKEERIKEKYGDIEKIIEEDGLEKALLLLKQMEPTSRTDAHLYFLQGKIYSKMKLYKEGISNFLKAVKYDPDYVDEGCVLYKGTLIKEVTLDAIDYYKDKKDEAGRDALKLVYAMQRRLAGSCE
jgi:tetratricopeptide (TPR) repeat protein